MSRRRRLRATPIKGRKQPVDARLRNFEEVSCPFTLAEAIAEASRCLQCEHHPCVDGCPGHNDIPGALWQLESGNIAEAALRFLETSNLPDICGRLCPQEKQCEGACVLNTAGKAVAIGKLESFILDFVRDRLGGYPIPDLAPPLGTRVAVVGSGPAGLAVAEELVKRGHGVTIFEAWPRPGGLLIYGIPGFKLNKRIAEAHIEYLQNLGVEFRCNTRIGPGLTVDDLLKLHGFDAAFLGHGASAGNRMKIPGEDFGNVYNATEYLVRGNLPFDYLPPAMQSRPHAGRRTVVVGGGDTAMDCVRTARRLYPDGEVWCVYRRSEAEMPGRMAERINAYEEGVKFEWLTLPVRFLSESEYAALRGGSGLSNPSSSSAPSALSPSSALESGILNLESSSSSAPSVLSPSPALESGILNLESSSSSAPSALSPSPVVACECIRMKLGAPDAKGRRSPVPIEGSNFILECDTAVIAIGYSVDDEIAQSTENLKTTKWGSIWVNSEEEGQTSREQEIWAAGDCVRGADLIVTAMVPARKTAIAIDRTLRARISKHP